MLTSILISTLACAISIPQTLAAAPPAEAPQDAVAADQEVEDPEERVRAAGEDVEKLLELAKEYREAPDRPALKRVLVRVSELEKDNEVALLGLQAEELLGKADACLEAKDRAGAKAIWEQVIELDTDNPFARKGLRHQRYAGRWFTSYVELSKYKREEVKRMEAEGKAKWTDPKTGEVLWVPMDDVPFMSMGWEQNSNDEWVNPFEVARAKEIERLQAAGHQYRPDDHSWIAPADFDKWREELYRCGDEWLNREEADKYHANRETPWQIAGEHYIVQTTREWERGRYARWHADQTHAELVRIFGVGPSSKPTVVVLRNLRGYNEVASGTAGLNESEGFSSIHGAYFADVSFDPSTTPTQYRGCGVTYWDTETAVGAWGPMWIRWAAAQSYIDAIDRSWGALGTFVASQGQGEPDVFGNAFWREKKIPRWLRYGAATYAERFIADYGAGEGEDPNRLRQFALAEIQKNGGMHTLDEIFAFQISLNDLDNSARLYQEAGLVVAYLLDTAKTDEKLAKCHADFKGALRSGDRKKVERAVTELQQELKKHGSKMKTYARPKKAPSANGKEAVPAEGGR